MRPCVTCVSLNLAKTREQIERDEGVVYEIYVCPLGHLTFGVGHLIRSEDPEHGMDVGTPVSRERVEEAFDNDLRDVMRDLKRLFGEEQWHAFPGEVKSILINMCFNLGVTRLGRFKKTIAAIKDQDYETAGIEMRDSLWYQQVTKRAERLARRMELLGD